MNRWSALGLLLALAVALGLRVPKTDTRPLHNDEGVNAVIVSELWEQGRYVYDPDEYHGPTLHYATLPFLWLSGASHSEALNDAVLRYAPIFFGVGLILLLPLFGDGLGRQTMVWSAIFAAISPAMVFYSRYFIHEMLLVFFTLLTLGAAWRYGQSRSAVWALMAGAGLGLMFATKETFVLSLAAMGGAGIITAWWTWPQGSRKKSLLALWNWKHAGLAIGAGILVWVLFFTSFFTNFAGLLDSVRTYLPWIKRAGGDSPHIHPWYFYLQRLAWFHPAKGPVWSEGLILLLAAIGAGVSSFQKKPPLHRFLALYTIMLTAIYSMISYKTPWCLLNFYLGMILLAGVGAAALVEGIRRPMLKFGMITLLFGLTLELTWQAWRASFVYAADRGNPYVYAQTSPNLLQLMERTEGVARVADGRYETVVKIMAPNHDYWPMPWYLRRFKHLGWYQEIPQDPYSPIVLVSSQFNARLDDKSDRKWIMAGIYELRPGTFFELYVELELWKKFVETLPPVED